MYILRWWLAFSEQMVPPPTVLPPATCVCACSRFAQSTQLFIRRWFAIRREALLYCSSALWSSARQYKGTTACNCFPLHCWSIALRSSKRRRHAIARSGRPADGSLPWQQRFLALPDFSHFATTINFSTLAAFCGLICPLAWPPSQNQQLTKKTK